MMDSLAEKWGPGTFPSRGHWKPVPWKSLHGSYGMRVLLNGVCPQEDTVVYSETMRVLVAVEDSKSSGSQAEYPHRHMCQAPRYGRPGVLPSVAVNQPALARSHDY